MHICSYMYIVHIYGVYGVYMYMYKVEQRSVFVLGVLYNVPCIYCILYALCNILYINCVYCVYLVYCAWGVVQPAAHLAIVTAITVYSCHHYHCQRRHHRCHHHNHHERSVWWWKKWLLGMAGQLFLWGEVDLCHIVVSRLVWSKHLQTSQELRLLSSVTINCQITKIVMNSGSQLSEL